MVFCFKFSNTMRMAKQFFLTVLRKGVVFNLYTIFLCPVVINVRTLFFFKFPVVTLLWGTLRY